MYCHLGKSHFHSRCSWTFREIPTGQFLRRTHLSTIVLYQHPTMTVDKRGGFGRMRCSPAMYQNGKRYPLSLRAFLHVLGQTIASSRIMWERHLPSSLTQAIMRSGSLSRGRKKVRGRLSVSRRRKASLSQSPRKSENLLLKTLQIPSTDFFDKLKTACLLFI